MYKVLDLFSGIGGFSLGLERTGGFETVAFCEIEKFPQKVLAKHWPKVPIYEDVRELTYERLRADGIFPSIITGGFPCQDISVAGNQKGIGEGTRSGLWSECARLVGEIRPDYAIFENVTALLSGDNGRWFQRVLFDLSEVGYDAEWHCISASELGANHHRDRVWIVAYPNGGRSWETGKPRIHTVKIGEGGAYNTSDGASQAVHATDTNGERLQRRESAVLSRRNITEGHGGAGSWWKAEPDICRVDDGLPDAAHRLKGLGNAVVPQIPELIGRAILGAE